MIEFIREFGLGFMLGFLLPGWFIATVVFPNTRWTEDDDEN